MAPPKGDREHSRTPKGTPRPGRNLAENVLRKHAVFLPAFCQPWPPQGEPKGPPGPHSGTQDPTETLNRHANQYNIIRKVQEKRTQRCNST